ncbi:MAG: hypothetical protein KKD07_08340 [Candidatus Omnitrophica bacterium]|nr:hypothetical protein [Candidatus Omnitrophota bacterium]MBU1995535.1 hypothetical protein [Candidatus Omnitrophota bacterium]MBU4334432.1 hypothetical protein [Candidatus Omnitrophota bacterium]
MKTRKIIIRSFITLLCIFLALEIILRLFFVKPSKHCYGVFNKLELAPCNMKYYDKNVKAAGDVIQIDHDMLFGVSVDGIDITIADIVGAFKEDRKCGYAYERNFTSVNNWWQSNNVGARYRRDVSSEIPQGYKRILVFGESFTHCRGVPQEETWPHFMEQGLERTEVLNFGVNGYSMTQSYLRFQQVISEIDYDTALFVFLPMDFVREVNIARCLRKWIGCRPVPRHILQDNELVLIESLYPDMNSFYQENDKRFSDRFRNYLNKYDRYYSHEKYEGRKVLGRSVLYKVLAAIYYEGKIARLNLRFIDPDSEAFQIISKLFNKVNDEAKMNGKDFILTFLPDKNNVQDYKSNKRYNQQWNKMVSEMCGSGLKCLDLMTVFKDLPETSFDRSYDGTHFGKKTNKIIADEIKRFIEKAQQ